VRLPGFNEVVQHAWNEPTPHAEPCHILFHRLCACQMGPETLLQHQNHDPRCSSHHPSS
jgi:hypothetical protein